MNYTKTIREYCLQNKGIVFDMLYELKKHFSMVPYRTFCKILSRLEEEGIVSKVSKGVYKVNGTDSSIQELIEKEYISGPSGMFIGKKMFEDLGIGLTDDKLI